MNSFFLRSIVESSGGSLTISSGGFAAKAQILFPKLGSSLKFKVRFSGDGRLSPHLPKTRLPHSFKSLLLIRQTSGRPLNNLS